MARIATYDVDQRPSIPKRPLSWFMKVLIAFAILLVIGVSYSFWTMSRAPSPAPTLDVPGAEQGTVPPAAPAPR